MACNNEHFFRGMNVPVGLNGSVPIPKVKHVLICSVGQVPAGLISHVKLNYAIWAPGYNKHISKADRQAHIKTSYFLAIKSQNKFSSQVADCHLVASNI